jgi:hypothetical protein
MKANRSAASFYFTGALVLPPFISFVWDSSPALLVFVFLLLAGAVCALADHHPDHRKPPGSRT